MTLDFTVSKQQLAWTNPCRNPIEGTAGVVKAQFAVDSEWDKLAITAIFENDGLLEQPEPVVWTGEPVTVPSLALSVAGRLRVGLVGYGDDGNIRLTTRRMAQGIPVLPSAGTGGAAVDPDPELWEQILAIIGDLDDLDTFVKTTLVAAINEAARSGSGGGLAFELGETLKLTDGTLDVNAAKSVEGGNSLPVTSNAVSVAVEAVRASLQQLTTRLNTLADSDDTTLDQLSEIVAYIKSNKSLIDQITTGKVSVSDIVNNLTSTATNKPLSANQGRALKALIDAITIPTKLPNPNALTFAGAATGTYDGSKALTITIPTVSGKNGREIELAATDGYIQWRYVGDDTWIPLVSLSDLTGEDGVGIQSVTQTTTSSADGGANIVTVTLTNGKKSTFTVKNGTKGSPGYTPIRGTDYWTVNDQTQIVSDVLNALPTWTGGSY